MAHQVGLASILTTRGVRKTIIIGAVTFFVLYSFSIGMVFRLPTPLPPTINTPMFDIIVDGPIGQVPWLIVYLDRFWVMSVSLEAGLSAILLSALFGLNMGFFFWAYKYSSCRFNLNSAISAFSALPAFFSIFSCCGGGLVTTILFALGIGGVWSGILLPYGRILSAASALLLISNLVLIYRRASRVMVSVQKEKGQG
ncbi:MAG: hypothetical protein QW756_07265, partial [Nitrososphaerota archaeon]